MSGSLAIARREAQVMGVPLPIRPIDALLECIKIAAGEVRYCSDRIADLTLEQAAGPVITTRPLKEEKGAESRTERVEDHGPPALHIWIKARHEAMDRLVTYSKIALANRIDERLVEIAKEEANQVAEAMKLLARALGFDPADPKVREAMRGSLTAIDGGLAA